MSRRLLVLWYRCLTREILESLLNALAEMALEAEDVATSVENLSGREWKILRLIGAGKSDDAIAGILRLSVGTLK